MSSRQIFAETLMGSDMGVLGIVDSLRPFREDKSVEPLSDDAADWLLMHQLTRTDKHDSLSDCPEFGTRFVGGGRE
jgi:hypothetical protein